MTRVERSVTRVKGFMDAEMDFQLLRMLGMTAYGGAAVGECLALIDRIKDGDTDDWTSQYTALADHLKNQATESLDQGHTMTAREMLLRASNYYRSAEYFCNPESPQQRKLGLLSRSCFIEAAKLLSYPVDVIEIPYENSWMPGYFIRPDQSTDKRKTVVIVTGFDGSGEEMFFQCAAGALERGFNALIFEGPGQTGMLRLHPELKFRPDYEVPVSRALDYALSRKEVDPARLAVYGISFGGYFVTRTAAHDQRIKAVIPNSPIVDLHAYMLSFIGITKENPGEDVRLDELDAIPDTVMPKVIKQSIRAGCYKFGTTTFLEFLHKLEAFQVGDALKNITCPSLIMLGEGEGDETMRQAEVYAKNVSGPVTKKLFTRQDGADTHCQLGNLVLSCGMAYDWLNEVFKENS